MMYWGLLVGWDRRYGLQGGDRGYLGSVRNCVNLGLGDDSLVEIFVWELLLVAWLGVLILVGI
jgi:hypothetical protein